MWESFEKISDGTKVRCKLCSKTYLFNGSTTSPMVKHLGTAHPLSPAAVSAKQEKCATEKSALAMQRFLGCQQISDKRKEKITSLLAAWCTSNLRPLSIVGDCGFLELLKFIEPGYKVPSRTNMSAVVRRQYGDLRERLISLLNSLDGVAITTDLWSSSANVAYATYSGHFLDAEWKLRTVCLDNKSFPERHTADYISASTKSVLEDLSVDLNKLSAVVSDQAANMVCAWRILESDLPDLLVVACACHRLQTALRHALDMASVSKLLAQCRRLVVHFKRSNIATHALKERQKKDGVKNPLNVIAEVPTRWNSTYDMLVRLNQLRVPLTAVMNDATVTKSGDQTLNLTASQWKLIEALGDLLEPFKGVTTDLSASRKVTISTVLPMLFGLWEHCQEQDEDPGLISTIKAELKRQLADRFHLKVIIQSSCEVLSSALDPRFKSLHFLEPNDQSKVYQEVQRRLELLFDKASTDDDLLEPPSKQPCMDNATLPAMKKQPSLLSRLAGKPVVDKPQAVRNSSKEEWKRYLAAEDCSIDADPLDWWRCNQNSFPAVAQLAKRILCVPASSTESERNFSAAGILTERRRARLGEDSLRAILFLNKNGTTLSEMSVQTSTIGASVVVKKDEQEAPALPDLSVDGDDDILLFE